MLPWKDYIKIWTSPPTRQNYSILLIDALEKRCGSQVYYLPAFRNGSADFREYPCISEGFFYEDTQREFLSRIPITEY